MVGSFDRAFECSTTIFWSDAEMKQGYEHGMSIMDFNDSSALSDLDSIVLILAQYVWY